MRKILSLVIALIVALMPLGALCEAPAAAPAAAEATAAPEAAPAAAEATAAPEAAPAAAEATAAPEPTAAPTPAPDPNKVVATVDGDNILYSEVDSYFQSMASQYAAYLDVTQESTRSMLMEQALNTAIQLKLILHKGAELGLDKLTDEEAAKIDEKAQADYDGSVEYCVSYFNQMGITGDDAKSQAVAMLETYGYTIDKLKEQYRLNETIKRVQASVTDPITVPEADVKTSYDGKVAEQKASYDADPSAYCAAKTYGSATYYAPAGIRTVKHILIAPAKIDEINALKTKIADEATAEADKKDAQTQLDALLAEPQPKLDEVTAKIKAGEDFQSLIDAYGEDPGMQAGAANAETGYYVCEGAGFDEAFLKAALALGKVGDVSEPVLGSYGYHIIRYESDVTPGEVGFDSVKEALTTELTDAKKSEAFTAALGEWQSAAKIERFE